MAELIATVDLLHLPCIERLIADLMEYQEVLWQRSLDGEPFSLGALERITAILDRIGG